MQGIKFKFILYMQCYLENLKLKINNKENIALLELKRKNMKTLDAMSNTKSIAEIQLDQTAIEAETQQQLAIVLAKT